MQKHVTFKNLCKKQNENNKIRYLILKSDLNPSCREKVSAAQNIKKLF